MTDLHCHVLPFVDDGSDSLENSISMVEEAVKQGVRNMVLTPHFRKGFFCEDDQRVIEVFEDFKKQVERRNLPVNLFLGREITVFKELTQMIENKKFLSLAGGKFVLLEFPYQIEVDIEEICYGVRLCGFIPVVAHVERYSYFRSVENVERLRKSGVVIQVNCAPVVNKSYAEENKFVKKLLKLKLVDVVASDYHYSRNNYMALAYQKVKSKYKDYADLIFKTNPEYIIKQD
ncbi:MAG: hypothetical protein IJW64_01190 [Clostridia bacterium]|nr:hypothetical protein [Clostridia bacterium]